MPVQQFGELLRSPSKLKKHILLVTLSALILAALAAAFLDQRLSLFFNHEDIRTTWRPVARVVTDIGLSDYYFVIAILTWALARWVLPRIASLKKYSAKIDYARRWGLSLLVALLVSGVLTHLIKATVGRQRPHKTPDFDPFVFDPFTTHWHWHSFSSGHSQVLFTAATMFSIAFPKLRWLWLAIAIIGCATRIVVHDHFLSDTIFGACVGYVGTLLALRLMMKKTPNSLH
ncbi:phosphatase PAP2 family protein [Bdellovibrio svalbardensis]|uniref:Phosphatase PAP2 family protein n=1 Tax=Bdellovibrio svalbardensis TaxID=2972972 RepID=A0ABT6DEC1_9BACT|nr:phosphatase PAP2 family protein [Bdellovibrio svalbardensis]MDG0815128.1 phosphatase PAP2 family protein [Bdellovibrio svalbardensis]